MPEASHPGRVQLFGIRTHGVKIVASVDSRGERTDVQGNLRYWEEGHCDDDDDRDNQWTVLQRQDLGGDGTFDVVTEHQVPHNADQEVQRELFITSEDCMADALWNRLTVAA